MVARISWKRTKIIVNGRSLFHSLNQTYPREAELWDYVHSRSFTAIGNAMEDRLVMDSDEMRRAITRIAHEVLERNHGARDLAFVGILRRGAPLAERLAALVEQIEGVRPPVGSLDIALYRDDYRERRAVVGRTDIPFDIEDKQIVLVDEVVYTGRTVRAAITALVDHGRPASIQLAVLLDRGHRELPIRPDYVGKNIPTARDEHVDCRLREVDGEDSVYIRRADDGA